jgi:hypothetical protein
MSHYAKSIGKKRALALAETKWWEGKPYRDIAKVQLFTAELCCPFSIFHEALEKSLGRPVYTHELGLNYDGICQEFLGERDPPTIEEIINMIPKEKRIVIQINERPDGQ